MAVALIAGTGGIERAAVESGLDLEDGSTVNPLTIVIDGTNAGTVKPSQLNMVKLAACLLGEELPECEIYINNFQQDDTRDGQPYCGLAPRFPLYTGERAIEIIKAMPTVDSESKRTGTVGEYVH